LAAGDSVYFSWNEPNDPGSGTVTDYRWAVDDADPSDGGWSAWQTEQTATWTAQSGEHIFYVQARDSLGNEGSIGSSPFGVDCTQGPTVTLNVDECTRADKKRPYWYWSATPNCAPELDPVNPYYFWFDADNDGVIDDEGYTSATSYTPSFDLSDGSHTLMVQAVDSCSQGSDIAVAEAAVDATPPTLSLTCSRGPDQDNLVDCSTYGLTCSADNVVQWNWTASDPLTSDASGLRAEDTYYVQTNFTGSYYTTDTSWGPEVVSDTEEKTTPTHWLDVTAYDACNNSATPSTRDELKIDTAAPGETIDEPAQTCSRSADVPAAFSGTATDQSCFGVTDVDARFNRDADATYWDGGGWSATEVWNDTSINDANPALDDGDSWPWTWNHGIDWGGFAGWSTSQDEDFELCLRGRDSGGFEQGSGGQSAYTCQALTVDNVSPTCSDTFLISDAIRGGPVTTMSDYILIETSGAFDRNCTNATYTASLYRGGIGESFLVWGPEVENDTICTSNGGYPNNSYIYSSLATAGTEDGDVLELCFDVLDCAGNRMTDRDCAIFSDPDFVVTDDGVCQYINIFDPPWFQAQGGPIYSGSTDETGAISSLVSGDSENPEPYLIAPPDDVAVTRGGVETHEGEVSASGWEVTDYSSQLYTARPFDYSYIWDLYGSPDDAPAVEISGNSLCVGTGKYKTIDDTDVCRSAGDLIIEAPPATPIQIQSGRKLLVFVDGDLQINRKIETPDDSVLIFVVSGNVYVDWKLESSGETDPITEAVFVVDGQFVAARDTTLTGQTCDPDGDPEGTCEYDPHNDPNRTSDTEPGRRAVFEGMVISYGGIELTPPDGRNLKGCLDGRTVCNRNTPAELFVYNKDFFNNLPDVLKERPLNWSEIKR
jgi:hypothetical protein